MIWQFAGVCRGRYLPIAEAAALMAAEAERQGIPASGTGSRGYARTHATLSRWEGEIDPPFIRGLGLMAKVYGVSVNDLMHGLLPVGS
jgi:transcriptional regulator with XRE-family HTH domain